MELKSSHSAPLAWQGTFHATTHNAQIKRLNLSVFCHKKAQKTPANKANKALFMCLLCLFVANERFVALLLREQTCHTCDGPD
jgi:hypothetical protein